MMSLSLVDRLRAWGLNPMAAALLEAVRGGPLAFLGAQVLHVAAPGVHLFTGDDSLAALAAVLEDPEATRRLARQLSEKTPV